MSDHLRPVLTFEEKCIDIFSDFFDDMELLSSAALGGAAATTNHRPRDPSSTADAGGRSLIVEEWLGAGATSAELEAARLHHQEHQHHDEELTLCMTEGEERREVLLHAARLRQQVIVEVCSALIPPLRTVRIHAATATTGSPKWSHSFHRLVCSQTTRECWLYPLRRIFPQGPVFVAKRIVDLFHRYVATDIVGPAGGAPHHQISDLETFLSSVTYEIALSPAAMMKRNFQLLEALVEVTFGIARARLGAAIASRFADHNHASDEAVHKTVVDDARDCLTDIKRRLTFIIRAVNGTESHWCYLVAFVSSCSDTAEQKNQQKHSTKRSVIVTTIHTVWAEVLHALNHWISVPSSLHLTELSKVSHASVQQADRVFRERQEYFLPEATRNDRVRSVTTALAENLPQVHQRLFYVERVAHLAPIPLRSRFVQPGGGGGDMMRSEFLKRANGFMLPRHRSPSMPDWMQPECEARGLTTLDRLGWTSRCFGDNPEFPSLHPDRGRVTAERVIAFHAFASSSTQHATAYRRWCQQVPMLRKYFRSLFIRSPAVVAQLDDAGRSQFMSALMSLLLEDPTATGSTDVFMVDAFDVLGEFSKVLPLGWSFDSVHRLSHFVQEHIIGFTTVGGDADGDRGAEQLGRIESIAAIAALVFTSIAETIVDGLVTSRSAFEARGSDERYDGAMCFSSEDAAIFEAFLKTMHDMLGVEFHVFTGEAPEPPPHVQRSMIGHGADKSDTLGSSLGHSPPLFSADFPSPLLSNFQTSALHHPEKTTGSHVWSEYGEWNVATVGPSVLAHSVAPAHPPAISTAGGPSPKTSPMMLFNPPPPPPPPASAQGQDVRIGLDARLLPLYLPWLKWVVNDLLVAPRFGEESAPVLSSDASMHLSCGNVVAEFLLIVMSRTSWSVGTVTTLCSLLDALSCSAGLKGHHHNVIAVSDVMRKGLTRKLFHGDAELLRVPLDAAAFRLMRGAGGDDGGPAADAIGTARATQVTHFLDTWRNFCTAFDQ